jgi:hypothetical protein
MGCDCDSSGYNSAWLTGYREACWDFADFLKYLKTDQQALTQPEDYHCVLQAWLLRRHELVEERRNEEQKRHWVPRIDRLR